MESPTKTDATPRASEYLIDRKNSEIEFLQRRINFLNQEHEDMTRKMLIAEIVLALMMFVGGFLLGWEYGP